MPTDGRSGHPARAASRIAGGAALIASFGAGASAQIAPRVLQGVVAQPAVRDGSPSLTGKTIAQDVGLQITAGVNSAYDSNIYRTDRRRTRSVDDFIITPSIQATYRRPVGVNSVRLSALVGYDRFVRESGRSKPRLNLNADADVTVAGTCRVLPVANYRIERADYGDLNQVSENLQNFTTLGVSATCDRGAGFFPEAGYQYRETENARRFDYANQRANGVSGGFGYTVPSIGTARVRVAYDDVDRPDVVSVPDAAGNSRVGFHNRILRIGGMFDRAVSPRTSIHVDVHALRLRTTSNDITDYTGVGYDISVTSRLLLPLTLQLAAQKTILNDSLTASGYAVETLLRGGATLPITERTLLTGSIDYHRRHFRQVQSVTFINRIDADRVLNFGATVTRRITDRFAIDGSASRSLRWTDPRLANYRDVRATLGARATF